MAKSQRPPEATDGTSAELVDAIIGLTMHVQVLREAIDELRSSIRWGLQNDKFRSPENPTIEPVEIDHEEIHATVRDACTEVSSDVSDAVRESLKEEMREMRDSLDQFSIDATWAVRQIRQAADTVKNQDSIDPVVSKVADNLGVEESSELKWLARKSFSGSSVVSHAAESALKAAPPPDGQGSLFQK